MCRKLWRDDPVDHEGEQLSFSGLRFLPKPIQAGGPPIHAGVVMLVWPWDSIVVLTLVVGVWLVVMGIIEIVRGFQMRNDSKTLREAGNVLRDRFDQAKKAS